MCTKSNMTTEETFGVISDIFKVLWNCSKGKGKGQPTTGHEGPEGEQIYSSTLPSNSALDGGWVVNATPRPLYPRERPGTHCIGGWVGPTAGLDGCGKFCRPPGFEARTVHLVASRYTDPWNCSSTN